MFKQFTVVCCVVSVELHTGRNKFRWNFNIIWTQRSFAVLSLQTVYVLSRIRTSHWMTTKLFTQQSLFNTFTQFNVYEVFSVNCSNCSDVDRLELNAINGSILFSSRGKWNGYTVAKTGNTGILEEANANETSLKSFWLEIHCKQQHRNEH